MWRSDSGVERSYALLERLRPFVEERALALAEGAVAWRLFARSSHARTHILATAVPPRPSLGRALVFAICRSISTVRPLSARKVRAYAAASVIAVMISGVLRQRSRLAGIP
jgi:hypothetical protein